MATALALTRTGPPSLSRDSVPLVVASGLTAVWLCVRAAFAVDPRVSLLGIVGQHTGAIVWIGVVGVLIMLLAFPHSDDLQMVTRIVAVSGAVAGVFAALDAAGLSESYRYSREVSGLLESSSSLGQLALLGVGAAIAWATIAKGTVGRAIAITFGAFGLAGLVLSQSRGAWVAALLAIIVVAVARAMSRRCSSSARWSAAAVVIIVIIGLLLTMWGSALSSETTFARFAEASNERAVIWRNATMQIAESPIIGHGPEQFSAWVTWSTEPGVSIEKTAAYDPHNLLMYVLLGGGVLALAGALGTMYFASKRLFETLSSASFGVAALVAAEVALVGSLMFTWTSPLAALFGAMLSGALLSAADHRSCKGIGADDVIARSEFGWALRSGVIAACVVAMVVLAPGVGAEYIWARALDRGGASPEVLLRTAQMTHDPSMYAASALSYPGETLEELRDAASWHVDSAFELNQAEYTALAVGSGGSWERIIESVESGTDADSASGMWDYLAATEATLLGLDGQAARFAIQALDHPLPDNARAWLEGLCDVSGN